MAGEEFLPKEYAYVVLDIVLYCLVNVYMQIQVGKARIKYSVFYPTLYAIESENENANLFNCVQRGHQNSLENMPVFFILMILGGIKHPIIAASLGLLYSLCRLLYFINYATGDPEKRVGPGAIGSVALLGLLVCTTSFAVHLFIWAR